MDDKETRAEAILDDLMLTVPLLFRTFLRSHESPGSSPLGSEFRLMGILMRHDALPTSRVGVWLGVSKSNMTAIVDKLAAEGKVARGRDAGDKRIVTVSLTEQGRTCMRSRLEEIRGAVRERLSTLTEGETEELYASLEAVRRIITKVNEAKQ